MILYHGSFMIVKHPKLLINQSKHDFGQGFYLTSDFDQAKQWAKVVVKRKKNKGDKHAMPIVNLYNIDEDTFSTLHYKELLLPNCEWLNVVCRCRLDKDILTEFDIVHGKVADAHPNSILEKVVANKIGYYTAIKRLKVNQLTDQYVFKTNRALTELHYMRYEKC